MRTSLSTFPALTFTLALCVTSPALAQNAHNAQAPQVTHTTPPAFDPSAHAPHPTPAQFAAFKSALTPCTDGKGAPLDAETRAEITQIINHSASDIDQLTLIQKAKIVEYASYPLFPKLPQFGPHYDTLPLADQEALKARSVIPRLDPPILCPFNAAAFPVLRWLADYDKIPRADRAMANGVLGILASEGITDQAWKSRYRQAEARAYFLKTYLFASAGRSVELGQPRHWSDGQDDDLRANIKRQGLDPYLHRTLAGRSGHFTRIIHGKELGLPKEE